MSFATDSVAVWLTPAATLLAVTIGAVTTWWLQRKSENDRSKAEAKAAARTLQAEIEGADSRILDALTDRTWWAFNRVSLQSWDSTRGVLAIHLDKPEWDEVKQCAISLRELDYGYTLSFSLGGVHHGAAGVEVKVSQVERLQSIRHQATTARNALAELAESDRTEGFISQVSGTGDTERDD